MKYSESDRRLCERVGVLVYTRRARLGWSRTALADLADVSVNTVGRIESGHPGVALGIFYRVLTVLNEAKKNPDFARRIKGSLVN